jgi:hypothetical protein
MVMLIGGLEVRAMNNTMLNDASKVAASHTAPVGKQLQLALQHSTQSTPHTTWHALQGWHFYTAAMTALR